MKFLSGKMRKDYFNVLLRWLDIMIFCSWEWKKKNLFIIDKSEGFFGSFWIIWIILAFCDVDGILGKKVGELVCFFHWRTSSILNISLVGPIFGTKGDLELKTSHFDIVWDKVYGKIKPSWNV